MDTMEKETQKEHTGDGMSISAMMTITAAVTMIHYEARESQFSEVAEERKLMNFS